MIKFLDLKKINLKYQHEIEKSLLKVYRSGWYLLGDEVGKFESSLCDLTNSKHSIAVANGLDGLRLILKSYIAMGIMKPGDEVLVPAHTYIASLLAITDNLLVPILIEPDEDNFNINISLIEEKITEKTKGIMIVHLYGRVVFSSELEKLAKKYSLKIIEDNAQAIGAQYNGVSTGNLGDAAAFSFYPGKNLGAIGDSGAVTTNDDMLAHTVKTIANYGSNKKYVNDYQGLNSRMDELQAAVLSVKIKYINKDNQLRRQIARRYLDGILNSNLVLPEWPNYDKEHVWHLFVIRTRSRKRFQDFMLENGVQTLIHYPIPPHKQKAYEHLNHLSFPITEKLHKEVVSIPISPVMTDKEVDMVIEIINKFS